MNKLHILLKTTGKFITDNSPLILTGVAAVGVVSTAVLAVRAVPRTVRWIDEQPNLHELPELAYPSAKAIVKEVWKDYIPALAVGTVTIVCIIGAQTVNTRRTAALATAYSLTETAFREYQNKVVETIGANKEDKVRAAIAEDRTAANPPSQNLIVTDNGEVLCYEMLTGRYFKSDIEKIRKAQNDINAQVINDMYASQNEFYRMIGLPTTGMGEELGWTTSNMMEIMFSAILVEGKTPCIAVAYSTQPIRDYYKFG